MATLSVANPTLLDLKLAMDPSGNIAKVVEILNQTNEVIDDAVFLEANELTGHTSVIRTGLPAPTWRKLYGGVQPTKSTRAKVKDSLGNLEAYAEVDCLLADMNGNTAAFRMSEDVAFIEGMNQEFAQTLFYGNEGTAPEEFTGFSARFNSLAAQNGENIVNGGGVGADNTSIWLVVWGQNSAHCIYPKGISGGLVMEDKGRVTLESVDGAGGRMEAYRTHYAWRTGLVVKDWRYVVRIANIDVSDLNTIANTKNLVQWMTEASEKVPSLGAGRAAFYCNRNTRTKLRLGILEKIAYNLTWETVAGKKVMMFDGIPVRRTDAILNTEAVVA